MKILITMSLVLATWLTVSHAENVATTSATSISQTQIEKAKMLNIDIEEWRRYETIMKGNRGYWTPNLHPLIVLGNNARTEKERHKYAQMLVDIEYARVGRELAFEKAYQQEFERKHPGGLSNLMKKKDTQSKSKSVWRR